MTWKRNDRRLLPIVQQSSRNSRTVTSTPTNTRSEEWEAIRKAERKASFNSGKWHRYVIGEGESPDYSITKSKPSVGKIMETNQKETFFKINNTDTQ